MSRGYDLSEKLGYRLMQGRLGVYDKYQSHETVLDPKLIGVQNQKMPQFCLGTKDDFERNSKFQFTSVWYNISKGVRQ